MRHTRKKDYIRRRTRKELRGGAPLARGAQGSVETIEVDGNGETHIVAVIKTTGRNVALREQQIATRLATIDPEQKYFIYGSRFEIPEKGSREKARIYMLYGGKPVLKTLDDIMYIIKNHKKHGEAGTKINYQSYYTQLAQFTLEELTAILKAFDPLIKNIGKLYGHGIIHNDIHSGNIVWDGTHLRLIDWGEAILEGEKGSAMIGGKIIPDADLFTVRGENWDMSSLEGEVKQLTNYIDYIIEHHLLNPA